MDLDERLTAIDCSTVPRFSFKGIDTLARVVNIYDPDTFTIIFEWADQFVKLNVRLDNIDAPDRKSVVPEEAALCKKGIEVLNELIGDKVVRVVLGKYDKYGRPLCTIYTLEPLDDGTTSINDYLINNHYVRQYSGDKKLPWTEQELKLVSGN